MLEQGRRHLVASEFDDAEFAVKRLTKPADFRFERIASEAAELLSQIEASRTEFTGKARRAATAARKAHDALDYRLVVEILTGLPKAVLDKQDRALLEQAQNAIREISSLKLKLRQALGEKDYAAAGPVISRLVELRPDSEKYASLAEEIGERLVRLAEQRYRNGDFRGALLQLDGIPRCVNAEKATHLRAQIEELYWLREQVVKSPFATPTLARLAERLIESVPNDKRAVKLRDQIRKRLKSKPALQRAAFPRWTESTRSESPKHIQPLGRLSQFGGDSSELFRKSPMRFTVALGLALQGIGESTFDIELCNTGLQASRGGLRRLLSKKQQNAKAWGLDIGSSSIKLVCLERQAEGVPLTVRSADYIPFEIPLSRPEMGLRGSQILREMLQKLNDKHGLENETIIVGLPSRQTLVRYTQLPPVTAKKQSQLIEAEVAHQFPLELDRIAWGSWVADCNPTSGEPRNLVLVATQASIARQRIDLMREAGLQPAGVQVTPVALANFMRSEFQSEVPRLDLDCGDQLVNPPAITAVDIGCDSSSLVVVSPAAFWFRSFDVAGDNMTRAIAQELNLTYKEADQLKNKVYECKRLADIYEKLDPVFRQFWDRVFSELSAAKAELGDCMLNELWTFGGASRMHGLYRHAWNESDG